MSSSENMRKSLTKLSLESTSNSSLPDDLVVSCLARVSRFYYPNLSLVSKSFSSILTSPELYKTRTLLGRTETFLYVCLRFPEETNPSWFTLYRKPNHTKKKTTKKESSGNILAPVPILNSPPEELSGFVAVDYNLYAINADIEDSTCSKVWFLDCRTHTWLEAPRMRIAQTNGRHDDVFMYLAGSCESTNALCFVEVYNTKTQTWKPALPEKPILKLSNLEGKIYTLLNSGVESLSPRLCVAFKPKDSTREVVHLDTDSNDISICMIENIIYTYYYGQFVWKKIYSEGERKNVEGLEGLPKFASDSTVKLADCGGKLVVLWDEYVPASEHKEKLIWCAEISLENRNNEEIRGKVEWFDAVLKVPKAYKLVCAVSATV